MNRIFPRLPCVMLAFLTLASCRSHHASSGLRDLGGVVLPSALFSHLCNNPKLAIRDEKQLLDSFLGSAFAITEKSGARETTTSADPVDVLAKYSCAEIWQKFQERPNFTIFSPVEDLSSLAMLNGIKNLELSYSINTLAKNIEILRSLDIVSMSFVGNDVDVIQLTPKDLTDILNTLAHIPTIKKIKLIGLGITNLDVLKPLVNVTSLDFTRNAVSDLGFLSDWTNLTDLVAYSNEIVDLNALRNLLQLEFLDLSVNNISDIGPLMFLGNLESLNFNANPALSDILALQFLPSLKYLSLNKSGVRIIDPLAKLPLERLSLENSPVESLEPIRQLPLRRLYIRGTKVKNLEPISTMTRLEVLNVAKTAVNEFPVLPASHPLHTVSLEGTNVVNFCPAYKHPTIKNLMLSNGSIWAPRDGIPRGC